MTKAVAVVVAAGILCVVGWKAATWTGSGARVERRATSPGFACAFTPGDELGYAVHTSTRVAEGGDDENVDRLDAALALRVLSRPAAGEWLVAAALRHAAIGQSLTAPEMRVTESLDAPFLIRIDTQCRILGVGFPPAFGTPARRFVRSLLASLSFRAGPVPSARRWEAEEEDSIGRYRAVYSVVEEPGKPAVVTKQGVEYAKTSAPALLAVIPRIVYARTTATVDPEGRWVRSMDGASRLQMKVQGRIFFDLMEQHTLVRDDAALPFPGLPDGASVDAFNWKNPFEESFVAQAAPVEAGLERVSLQDALGEFTRRNASTPGGASFKAARYLADWLKVHPGEANAIIQAIRGGELSAVLQAAAFHALELCGTREANLALAAAVRDRSLRPMNNAQAASALSDVPKPTRETLDALIETSTATAPGNQDAQLVSGSSVRALGHLALRTEGTDSELHSAARSALERELRDAQDGSRTVDVVDAIGNTGDESFLPALEKLRDSESPPLREHAARAMRLMEPSRVEAVLAAWFPREPDATARAGIVETLLQVTQAGRAASAATLQACASGLATEAVPGVRQPLIQLLGGAAGTSSIAKAALVEDFHREREAFLLRMIGSYVTVEDLR